MGAKTHGDATSMDEVQNRRNMARTGIWVIPAFVLASLCAVIADLSIAVYIRHQAWATLPVLYLIGVAALGGFLLGSIVQLLLLLLTRRVNNRPFSFRDPVSFLVTASLGIGLIYINQALFEGARIRENTYLSLIKVGFSLCVMVAAALSIKVVLLVSQKASSATLVTRWSMASLFLAAASGLYAVDLTFLTKQYTFVHMQLAIANLFVVAIGLLLLQGVLTRSRTISVFLAVMLLSIMGAFLIRTHDEIKRIRGDAMALAPSVSRWFLLPERIFEFLSPLDVNAEVGVSEILKTWHITAAQRDTFQERLDSLLPQRRDLNLLVVSIDTLRTDHVGGFGYAKATTPNLDRLMAQSLSFARCYTPYPTSAWAYSSFMSGRYPSAAPVAQIMENPHIKIDRDVTLAGLLGKSGFRTHGRSAFNRSTLMQRSIFGHLKEGFDTFNPVQEIKAVAAPILTTRGLQVLKETKGQFFLWMHYLEPHDPYEKNPRFDFGDSRIGRYDGEIAAADFELGRLLTALEKKGIADKTVVVVMSDHGEEFKEHNGLYHNSSLYEEQVRVPLVIYVPGLEGKRIETPISLVDFLPTISWLFDIKDSQMRNGQPLWPLIFDGSRPHPHIFSELRGSHAHAADDLEMVVFQGRKLIRNSRRHTEIIFDLESDPNEERNILGRDARSDAILRGLLSASQAAVRHVLGHDDDLQDPTIDEKWIRQEIVNILASEPAKLPALIGAFTSRFLDPVEGLDPSKAEFFAPQSSLRQQLLELFSVIYSPGEPRLAGPILSMVEGGRMREFLPVLSARPTDHPLVLPQVLFLRGVFQDTTCLSELQAEYARSGSREKYRLLTGLVALGAKVEDTRILAALQVRAPLVTALLLRELGKRRWPLLLETADLLVMEKVWSFEIVKTSLIAALADLPSSPRRDRLLGCLSSDLHPRISLRAKAALRKLVPESDRAGWLQSGAAEMEGRRAIRARSLGTALQSFTTAASTAPVQDASLLAFRARVFQAQGKLKEARAALKQGDRAAITVDRSSHVESWGPLFLGDPHVSFRLIGLEPKQMRNSLYFVDVELTNHGPLALPGGTDTAAVKIVPLFLDEKGRLVKVTQVWPVALGVSDLGAQEKRRFSVALASPRKLGKYQLAVQLKLTAPSRAKISAPQILGDVEVVGNTSRKAMKPKEK